MNDKDMALHPEDEFEANRARAAELLIRAALCCVPVTALTAYLTGAPLLLAAGISATFAAIGFSARHAAPEVTRVMAAVALIGQCIGFTAAFAGHHWQLDSHMAFFAVLAALVAMTDLRAILVAVALTAVHHLSLTLAFPALIYPDGALLPNLGRVVLHAGIVLLEAAALIGQITMSQRAHRNQLRQTQALEESAAATAAALAEARLAAETAEHARAESLRAADGIRAAQARSEEEARRAAEADAAARATEQRGAEERRQREAALSEVVNALKTALRAIAAGDMTAAIDRPFPEGLDEIRLDFNRAVRQLDQSLAGIRSMAQMAHADSESIRSHTQDMWRRSERQAASVEESSAALEELVASIRQATELARKARGVSGRTREGAEQGNRIIEEMIAAMEGIEASSDQISKITGLIDNISFQTNLLALNAGVEAARAGDAGRGFAVVASEVRALAQKSAEAAKEISALISASDKQVKSGVDLVGRTGTALREVVRGVQDVSQMIGEIAATAEEQSTTVSELSNAISEIDRSLQTNVGLFVESNATTDEMTRHTGAVETAVARFRISDGTAATGRHAA